MTRALREQPRVWSTLVERIDMEQRTCVGCAVPLTPNPRERNKRKWCSEACRRRTGYAANQEAECKRVSERRAENRAALLARVTPIKYVSCLSCGATLVRPAAVSGRPRSFCSRTCRNRRVKSQQDPSMARARQRRYVQAHPEQFGWTDAKKAAWHRRRALKLNGAAGERIVPAEVFARDGWRCGICGKPVSPVIEWPHPQSASLDHIVPLSKGGAHSLVTSSWPTSDAISGRAIPSRAPNFA